MTESLAEWIGFTRFAEEFCHEQSERRGRRQRKLSKGTFNAIQGEGTLSKVHALSCAHRIVAGPRRHKYDA